MCGNLGTNDESLNLSIRDNMGGEGGGLLKDG